MAGYSRPIDWSLLGGFAVTPPAAGLAGVVDFTGIPAGVQAEETTSTGDEFQCQFKPARRRRTRTDHGWRQ